MSVADVDPMNPVNHRGADALTPAPAPMPMPAREMRTVGGLMMSAMAGIASWAPATLSPAAMPKRAAVPTVENKATPR